MLERRAGRVQMGTQQRRVKPRSCDSIIRWLRATGRCRLSCVSKSDRLVPERCENFLVPQEPLAVDFQYENGLPGSATHRAGCFVPRHGLNDRDRGKPDIEARARTGRTLHIHSPAVIQDNLEPLQDRDRFLRDAS